MYIGTAIGDAEHMTARMSEAARVAGFDLTPLRALPDAQHRGRRGGRPRTGRRLGHGRLGRQPAGRLARPRPRPDIRRAWESGVVLSGVSAGSICWFQGGTTDSFGPRLRPVTDALGYLPYGNGVHYDSDEGRRPWSTPSSPTAPSRRPTARTTASASSTGAPGWWRRSPNSRARAYIVRPGGRHGDGGAGGAPPPAGAAHLSALAAPLKNPPRPLQRSPQGERGLGLDAGQLLRVADVVDAGDAGVLDPHRGDAVDLAVEAEQQRRAAVDRRSVRR